MKLLPVYTLKNVYLNLLFFSSTIITITVLLSAIFNLDHTDDIQSRILLLYSGENFFELKSELTSALYCLFSFCLLNVINLNSSTNVLSAI